MRLSKITPTGVEKNFRDDEIIVSKTDTKGLLTYVNDLFIEISGYPEDELIGQPHNVIRHPEMPRIIFKLLWDSIADGREIFAYVMNLSADGSHYWVLAHVTPTHGPDGSILGYHSNRRTASAQALERVKPLYAALLAEERRQPSTPAALEASARMLEETLVQAGMSYDEFVWSLDSLQESAA